MGIEGKHPKMNSFSIELNESMIGKIGVTLEGSKWIVKEFRTPNGIRYDLIAQIKCLVEQKINNWQQKGEFEKLFFQVRVTENNRSQKIREYQEEVKLIL